MSAAAAQQIDTTARRLSAAIAAATVSGRMWLYSNYHCNLACAYCLTESGPGVPARVMAAERMRTLARDARDLGFTSLGVTGGEPFLRPELPELLGDFAEVLPLVVLTNGTLFSRRLLDRLAPLAGQAVVLQISLDRPDPASNDLLRAPDNFRKVVQAIPHLVERGLEVRIATTLLEEDAAELARLCDLHRSLGVTDEHHIVRPVVRRGRAETGDMGITARHTDLDPEFTATIDGAFWSPFGPTVAGGVLDVDLLITRITDPLHRAVDRFLDLAEQRPPGNDGVLNIR